MTHGSLFSGIGGFDLAAEWSGFTNLFNCEWEEFPRKVLKHHFPNAEQYEDIHDFNATAYSGKLDILSGGFPCQPFSVAGKRKGSEDERHLWPEMLRVIGECKPRWVVGENVRGLCSWSNGLVFEEVCADLEAIGYSVQSFIIPACAAGNAPHRRDRVWIVAKNTDRDGRRSDKREKESNFREFGDVGAGDNERIQPNYDEAGNAPDTGGEGCERDEFNGTFEGGKWHGNESHWTTSELYKIPHWEDFPTVPPVCGGDDGLPKELDGITFPKWRRESIKAYGNAIVPQVAYRIFESIQDYEKRT
jgi:DNA (cytosine-5)-methyltransferase 1